MSAAEDPGGAALVDALDYAAAGYKVGPVTVRLKADGKKGALFHTAWKDDDGISDDPEQIKAWAREHPGCGFHAPTGPNGIVVAEGDVKTDAMGYKWKNGIESWRRAGGPSSPMTVTTRSGGEHWYFRAPAEPIGNSANAIEGIPHVDVRGNRGDRSGTVFISGTVVHGGGGTYVANRIIPPDDLPELPPKWADRLRKAGPSAKETAPAEKKAAGERAPRREGLVLASSFHTAGWIEAKARDAMRQLGREGRGDFRARLYSAALFGYRALGAGVIDEAEVDLMLEAAISAVWDSGPDADDQRWIREAAREAERTPWHVEHVDPEPVADLEPGDVIDPVDPVTGEEKTPEQLAQERYDRDLDHELTRERLKRDAARRLQAEEAPKLRVLGFADFLASPLPEPLIDGLFYRDSLSRVFGAPGCGKSFLALDLALSVALGREWAGEAVEQGPVVYVMAEGQRVNTQRAGAWLERNRVDPAELEGRFFTVPDAVMLTEEAARPFVEWVGEVRPALVVLDTKNAMMVGEESSATDFAILRRVLDQVRKAAGGACVVLIDHTGYEGTRARGSSAGTAAMDTEVRVENDGGRPAHVTVTVSRDKAAEDGRSWAFFLRMAGEAAVLVPTDEEPDQRPDKSAPDWRAAEGVAVPTELLHYEGPGAKVMPTLARFLAHDASPRHEDPNGVGVSRLEAQRAMRVEGFRDDTVVRRAWSALIAGGWIDRADKVTSDTGRHVWTH